MLSKNKKADVLVTVTVEVHAMFGVLANHYKRPEYVEGLPELEKIESYLLTKLAEYDPAYKDLFTELLKSNKLHHKKTAKILSAVLEKAQAEQ